MGRLELGGSRRDETKGMPLGGAGRTAGPAQGAACAIRPLLVLRVRPRTTAHDDSAHSGHPASWRVYFSHP